MYVDPFPEFDNYEFINQTFAIRLLSITNFLKDHRYVYRDVDHSCQQRDTEFNAFLPIKEEIREGEREGKRAKYKKKITTSGFVVLRTILLIRLNNPIIRTGGIGLNNDSWR